MKNLFFLGDIHGNFNYMLWQLKQEIIKDAHLIQVGDFGLGFIDYEKDIHNMTEINKSLIKNNVHLWVIRGNHDNPLFWNGHVDGKWENLHLVKDYTVQNLSGYNVLFVGGALSIDRKSRLNDMQQYASKGVKKELYWFDENFNLDTDKLKELKEIDIVVTHTAPDFCYPNNKFGFSPIVDSLAKYDPELKAELIAERNLITDMYNVIMENNNPRMWFYGHFHTSKIDNFNGVEFRLLDINEVFMYRDKDYEDELNQLYGN